MGGETFLYRKLHELLSYLIRQDKIGLVHLFTNGSIIPGKDILRLLQHRKILVSVSSFPAEVSPNKHLFIATLEANNINLVVEDKL
jgi:MoaA/NifB/PqqE/SkfB family radical SAM enzyme